MPHPPLPVDYEAGSPLNASDLAWISREAIRCRALGRPVTLNAADCLALVEMARDAHDLAHENRELGSKHLPKWMHRKQSIDAAKGDAETRAALEQLRQDRARGNGASGGES